MCFDRMFAGRIVAQERGGGALVGKPRNSNLKLRDARLQIGQPISYGFLWQHYLNYTIYLKGKFGEIC